MCLFSLQCSVVIIKVIVLSLSSVLFQGLFVTAYSWFRYKYFSWSAACLLVPVSSVQSLICFLVLHLESPTPRKHIPKVFHRSISCEEIFYAPYPVKWNIAVLPEKYCSRNFFYIAYDSNQYLIRHILQNET